MNLFTAKEMNLFTELETYADGYFSLRKNSYKYVWQQM